MKVVDRKTFLELPANTLFSPWTPCVFGELKIKGPTLFGKDGEANDYIETSIADSLELPTGVDGIIPLMMLDDGAKIAVDLWLDQAHGFDADDLRFAVWSRDDVVELIARLSTCLR